MQIVHQDALFSSTLTPPPVLLLPAPPKRLCLPAPKRPAIAGLLPAPKIAGYLPAVCGGRGHRIAPTDDGLQGQAQIISGGRIHGFAPTKIVDGLDADGRGHRAAPTADQSEEGDNLPSPASSLITHHSSLPFSPQSSRRVVTLEVADPLQLINIYEDPEAWWAEFERIHGKIKTIEEMDDEIEAKHPSYAAMRHSPRRVRV